MSFTPCSIPGCTRNAHWRAKGARGWCSPHYKRWHRNGDPLGGNLSPGTLAAWIEEHKDYEGDDCLVWPFCRNSHGYGEHQNNKVTRPASRSMCEAAHGPPPDPSWDAAHSCGNGHLGCVNPNHLRWKTHQDNIVEAKIHGTWLIGERHPMARLSDDEVRELRDLVARGVDRADVAQRFGVHKSHVNSICNGSRRSDTFNEAASQ